MKTGRPRTCECGGCKKCQNRESMARRAESARREAMGLDPIPLRKGGPKPGSVIGYYERPNARVMRPCPGCGVEFMASELITHRSACPSKQKKQKKQKEKRVKQERRKWLPRAQQLRAQGMTLQSIATELGITRQAVHQGLTRISPDTEGAE